MILSLLVPTSWGGRIPPALVHLDVAGTLVLQGAMCGLTSTDGFQLTMQFPPNKSISWKPQESKLHWICLLNHTSFCSPTQHAVEDGLFPVNQELCTENLVFKESCKYSKNPEQLRGGSQNIFLEETVSGTWDKGRDNEEFWKGRWRKIRY